MEAKKIDELTLGATYWCVPKAGLEVRKAPRVSYAKGGEYAALTTDLVRRLQDGDVALFDAPPVPGAPQPEALASDEPAAPVAQDNAAPAAAKPESKRSRPQGE